MSRDIQRINLLLPLKMGNVNCYLIKTGTGYILIDTGNSNKRTELEKELERRGCQPGNLEVIILTHGDFDHTGNAAYLREKFSAKIAMHYDDAGMAEHGNMFWNRKKSNFIIRVLAPILSGFGKSERFKPDLYLNDGDTLAEFGVDARILHIPGHSKGSIGILTTNGDLICGDLFENRNKPVLNSIMDDPVTANTSVLRLNRLNIGTVYPGHGTPFLMESLKK